MKSSTLATRHADLQDLLARSAGFFKSENDVWMWLLTGKCWLNGLVAHLLDTWAGKLYHKRTRVRALQLRAVEGRNLVVGEKQRRFVYPTAEHLKVLPCNKATLPDPLPSEWIDSLLTSKHLVALVLLEDERRLLLDVTSAQYGSFRCDLVPLWKHPVTLAPLDEIKHVADVATVCSSDGDDDELHPAVWHAHRMQSSRTKPDDRTERAYRDILADVTTCLASKLTGPRVTVVL